MVVYIMREDSRNLFGETRKIWNETEEFVVEEMVWFKWKNRKEKSDGVSSCCCLMVLSEFAHTLFKTALMK